MKDTLSNLIPLLAQVGDLTTRRAEESGQLIGAVFPVPVCVIGLPLLLWWLAYRNRRKVTTSSGEPQCGRCGYLVRGLSELNCPECGADLREVGIHRSAATSLVWTLLIWTVACTFAIVIAFCLMLFFFGLFSGKWGDIDRYSDWVPGTIFGVHISSWIIGILTLIHWHRHPLAPSASGNDNRLQRPGASQATQASDATVSIPSDAVKTRTLTIMFIDMEGYTERTANSSRGALIELIQQLRQLIQPIVNERGGRIVKTIGDGVLVTFESPTEALLTGNRIQRAVREQNQSANDFAPLALRIGVTTGEVAVEANDVYGDPVNLASRIQTLADSGQVFFSEGAFHAMNKNEVPHETAGEFEVKGVEDKIRLYRTVE